MKLLLIFLIICDTIAFVRSDTRTVGAYRRVPLRLRKMSVGAVFRDDRYGGSRLKSVFGGVAQLGERTVRIRKVESSILFVSTKE